MQKLYIKTALSFLLALLCITPYGYCTEKTPEQFIKDFYIWYITVNKGMSLALNDDDIYHYVAPETVEKVKKQSWGDGRDRRDYFLKMCDPPLDMSGASILVGKVTDMGAGTYVAPVTITTTLGEDDYRHDNIVVIFKTINSFLKITKCIDIYPEA